MLVSAQSVTPKKINEKVILGSFFGRHRTKARRGKNSFFFSRSLFLFSHFKRSASG